MSNNNKEEILYPGSPLVNEELNEAYFQEQSFQEQSFPQDIHLHYENPAPEEERSRFGKFERPEEPKDKPIRKYTYKRPPDEDYHYPAPPEETDPFKFIKVLSVGLAIFILLLMIFSYKADIKSLEDDVATLTATNTSLENEKATLKTKADWFDTSCKIVVADSGYLYNTYHTYDCLKWRGHSFWIYNKEQVINNSRYIKCPDCN